MRREQTLSSIRSRFWILASRRLIHSITKHCLYCKREKAAPVTLFMANVTSNRLCFNEKPFLKTGVDYLEPYHMVDPSTIQCTLLVFGVSLPIKRPVQSQFQFLQNQAQSLPD